MPKKSRFTKPLEPVLHQKKDRSPRRAERSLRQQKVAYGILKLLRQSVVLNAYDVDEKLSVVYEKYQTGHSIQCSHTTHLFNRLAY